MWMIIIRMDIKWNKNPVAANKAICSNTRLLQDNNDTLEDTRVMRHITVILVGCFEADKGKQVFII